MSDSEMSSESDSPGAGNSPKAEAQKAEAQKAETKQTEAEPRHRCLVVLPPDLGSALWSLSALASLSQSRRLVVVIATEDQMAILDPTLLQWRLRDYPKHVAVPVTLLRDTVTAKSLAALKFDEAFFTAPDWRDVGLARKAGIRRLWGFRGGPAGFRLTHAVPPPASPAEHRSERLKPLVRAMGVAWRPVELGAPELHIPELHIPETWNRVGKERLEKARLKVGESPILGVFVGGDGGAVWPAEQFEGLLQGLRRHHPDWQFVILSTDDELWSSVLLHERTGKIHPVVGPELSLDGLAAVLLNLDLFISSGSELLQLCALVGTPTLGLFQKDGRRRAPRSKGHRHLERNPLKSLSAEDVLPVCEAMMTRRQG